MTLIINSKIYWPLTVAEETHFLCQNRIRSAFLDNEICEKFCANTGFSLLNKQLLVFYCHIQQISVATSEV